MTKAFLLASLLLGACTVGEVQLGNQGGTDAGGGGGTDSGGGGGTDAPSGELACSDRGVVGAAHVHGGGAGGGTKAGIGCMAAAGCHANGTNQGTPFGFAGTIYKQGTTTPDPGAVIVIVPDSGANPIKIVADDAGNFHAAPVSGSMPASAAATACPTIVRGHLAGKLNGQSTPGKGGDCNSCHATGGAQPPLYVGP